MHIVILLLVSWFIFKIFYGAHQLEVEKKARLRKQKEERRHANKL